MLFVSSVSQSDDDKAVLNESATVAPYGNNLCKINGQFGPDYCIRPQIAEKSKKTTRIDGFART